MAFVPELADVEAEKDSVHDRDSENRYKANRRGDTEGGMRDQERQDSAKASDRNLGHNDEGVDQRSSRAIENSRNQNKRERHHDHQAPIGCLKLAVLARPLEMHALGQPHLAGDAGFGVVNRALEIPASNREAHRDIAFEILAVNERRAFG